MVKMLVEAYPASWRLNGSCGSPGEVAPTELHAAMLSAAAGPQKRTVVDLTTRGGLPGLAGLGNRKRGSVDAFMLPRRS